MIRHLTLSNFKAFGPEQQIPLRPITLIFGGNSAGKSSIIHSLLLAHHAQQKDTWHVGSPILAGDSVDLGGFHQYVHRQDSSRAMRLMLTCEVPLYCKRNPFLHSAGQVTLAMDVAAKGNEWRDGDVERGLPSLHRCEVTLDDMPLFTLSRDDEDIMRPHLDSAHPAVEALVERFSQQSAVKHLGHDLTTEIAEELQSMCANAEFGETAVFPGRVSFSHELFDEETDSDAPPLRAMVRAYFTPLLAGLFAALHRCFEDNLGQLEYLGPLRSLPERFIPETEGTAPNWKSGGAFAWQSIKDSKSLCADVNRWLEIMGVRYYFKVRRLADEDSIEKAVSEYLRDRAEPRLLQALADSESAGDGTLAERLTLSDDDYRAYVLANPELHACLAEHWLEHHAKTVHGEYSMDEAVRDVLEKRMDQHPELVGVWDELRLEYPEGNPKIEAVQSQLADPKVIANGVRDNIISRLTDRRTDLKLVDGHNGTPVTTRDVGIGISQMVPVLVHALGSRNKLIAIEQPEIHLHPALQAELGDLFIESALGKNKNSFLLETHSEHLILRVMKRIRETTRKSLPGGTQPITPDDVTVLYVLAGENGSTVQELRIDEQGRFVDNWPQGFFDERLDELF